VGKYDFSILASCRILGGAESTAAGACSCLVKRTLCGNPHRHGWLQRLRIGGQEDRCAALLPSGRLCPDAHEKCNLQGQTLTMSERWTRWRRRSPRRRVVLVHSLPLANIQLTHWLCRTQRPGRCQSVHAKTVRIRNHQAAPLRRSFSTFPKPQAQVRVLCHHQCLDVHILSASDRMMTPVFSCGQNGASGFGQSPMKMMTVAIRRTIGMRPGQLHTQSRGPGTRPLHVRGLIR